MKLLEHNYNNGFHYFSMQGERDIYNLIVVKVPQGVEGYGWSDRYYLVVNEDAGASYLFIKSYFDGSNVDYLPGRIKIEESNAVDFMNCVKTYVYPVI